MEHYGYISGYTPNRHLSIDQIIIDFEARVAILDKLFNVGTSFNKDWLVRAHDACPEWVEKFFPTFAWQKIATTYNQALWLILKQKGFSDLLTRIIGDKYLSQLQKETDKLSLLGVQQGGADIRIVPGQFGIRYTGSRASEVCRKVSQDEALLGAFDVAVMLLSHPERLKSVYDLDVVCAGDICRVSTSSYFSDVPVFNPGSTVGPQLLSLYSETPMEYCGFASAHIPSF